MDILPVVIDLFFRKFFNRGLFAKFLNLCVSWLLAILETISVNFYNFHDLPYRFSIPYLARLLHYNFIWVQFIWRTFFIRRGCDVVVQRIEIFSQLKFILVVLLHRILLYRCLALCLLPYKLLVRTVILMLLGRDVSFFLLHWWLLGHFLYWFTSTTGCSFDDVLRPTFSLHTTWGWSVVVWWGRLATTTFGLRVSWSRSIVLLDLSASATNSTSRPNATFAALALPIAHVSRPFDRSTHISRRIYRSLYPLGRRSTILKPRIPDDLFIIRNRWFLDSFRLCP